MSIKIADSDSSSRSSARKKKTVIRCPSCIYELAEYMKNKRIKGVLSAFLARFSQGGLFN